MSNESKIVSYREHPEVVEHFEKLKKVKGTYKFNRTSWIKDATFKKMKKESK